AANSGKPLDVPSTASDTVWGWGANFSNQLGPGDYTQVVPVSVAINSSVTDLAAGYSHSLALTAGGTVLGWGGKSQGQAHGVANSFSNLPTAVLGVGPAMSISAGYSHSLAFASNGLIYAWGSNFYGELGISTDQRPSSPIATAKDTNHSGMPDQWQLDHFGHT